MVDVGEKAPDFALKDQNENEVTLGDYAGKKLLVSFFPFAFSPVCTEELGCFESDMEQFKAKGVAVVGISVDSTWSNKAFADKLGVNYPLLSDFGKEASKAFGVLREEGFSERAYFLIDEQGVVKYKHVMDSPAHKLDNEALLKALEE